MDVSNSKLMRSGRCRLASVLAGLFLFGLSLVPTRSAYACSLCDPIFNLAQVQIINAYAELKHEQTRRNVNRHTDEQFEKQKDWDLNVFFNDYWGNAMMLMAEQLSAVALDQMMIVGTFFDAKHQLETQRLFGQLAAQAHKDYQPSEGLCSMGSTYRNLAYAERNADLTSWTLSRRSLARQLMNKNSIGTEGQVTDSASRVALYLKTYCDKNDNARNLDGICDNGVTNERKNKDVDFVRTLYSPMSLDANFSDNTATNDETDLLAFQANIFANTINKTAMASGYVDQQYNVYTGKQDGNLQQFLDLRAIAAMRGVAQTSFNDLAGMKTSGSTTASGNALYIQAAIKQLSPGMSDADAQKIAGNNPSYDAQMEILTQKLLQDSQFYTDLYDKPANIARKGAALQAIATIQDRDNYKSTLRSEMLWSQLLELKLIEAQSNMQNRINGVK